MARFVVVAIALAARGAAAAADILLASFDGKASHQWKQMNDPVPRLRVQS